MGIKALKECNKVGCHNLTKNVYCELHTKNQTEESKAKRNECDARRGSANQRGYTYAWQKYSKSFLRKNPLCVHCLKQSILTPSEVTDHIIDHKGNHKLFWDAANHQALCKRCHDRKTAATAHATCTKSPTYG